MSSERALPLLALFEKRVEGDDALLSLARLRFEQAGLGAEIHAHCPDSLASLLPFVHAFPSRSSFTCHVT